MMTTLRSQMKLILWILVFAFLATIVFSWGMGGFKERGAKPGQLGVINGLPMNVEAFEQTINRKVQYQASQDGKEMDQDAIQKLREDTWDNQIESILKDKEERKLDISAGDRAIAWVIENNPPKEVQTAPAFQTDGKFDISKYQTFLRDPQATQFLLGVEGSVSNFIKEQALIFQASLATPITEEEIKDTYLEGASVGKLRFLFFPYDSYKPDSSDITTDMMRRYYQLFQDKYRSFAQRRFAYVKFKLAPSAADSDDVLKEAERIMGEAKGGGDFEALAEQYSQDPGSAVKGGDLGWFGEGTMVKEFDEAAFAAKPGDILGPVSSKFGLHIINVEDKRTTDGKPEILARHILLKIEPSPDTRDQVHTDATNFATDVKERGFEAVAKEFGYDIDSTSFFGESGYITGLGRLKMAADFCFNNKVGTVSDVYQVPEGYIVFKITGANDEATKPFADVQESVRKSLERVLERQRAWGAAAGIRGKVQSFDDLVSQASLANMTVYASDDSLRPTGTLPSGLKKDKDFLTQAFRLDKGDISDVIIGRQGCYIAYMQWKSDFSKDDYQAVHTEIFQKLMNDKQDAAEKDWIRQLRLAADIKDYRYKYYHDF